MADYEILIYTNSRGETLVFSPLSTLHTNVANDVTGLGDISNTIFTSSSMAQDGETYIGQKFDIRPITIKGTINSTNKDTVLEIRRKMQKTLNPKLSATLTYVYKTYTRVIDVKAEDTPVFARKAVFTTFTIKLTCCSPFWRKDAENKDDIAAWVAEFEFPLEIDATDGVEFGYREPSLIVDVYNEGDVETDMRIEFRATGTLTNPLLLNVNTGEYIQINATMQAGDKITVTTKYGEKGAVLLRGTTEINYFRYVDVDSTFMQLAIGDNVFRYNAASGLDALEVTIYHSDKYLGV